MRWTIRRTRWGYSLFFDGELVASADTSEQLLYGMNTCCGVGGQG